MRIDINGTPYNGSFEQVGQDFILHLDAAPSVEIGEEIEMDFYDEDESLSMSVYKRIAQSIDGSTLHAHLEIEPQPSPEERIAELEALLDALLRGETDD